MSELNMFGISAELPHLTAGNFETCLASDEVLVHFFNDFLSLPSFPEALYYARESGLFEVVNGVAEFVSTRSDLHRNKSQLLTYSTLMHRSTQRDNHYSVCRLDREQGIQWIMKERLPFFLQSDCYTEYRLAKLMFQCGSNLCIQRSRSGRTTLSASQLHCSSQTDKENGALKEPICLHSQESLSSKQGSEGMYKFTYLCCDQHGHINTKCSESPRWFYRCSELEDPHTIPFLFSPCSSFFDPKCEKTQQLQSEKTEMSLYFTEPSPGNPEEQHFQESGIHNFESSELQLTYLSTRLIKQVLNNALKEMYSQNQANISDCVTKSRDGANCFSKKKSYECKVCQLSGDEDRERFKEKKEKVQEDKRASVMEEKTKWDRKNREVHNKVTYQQRIPDSCCHGACCHNIRPGLDVFKEFLRGTPGEKLTNLWIDIEKLKIIHHREQKNRHLVLMRSRYLLSSSPSSLNTELLSRLGLSTSPCWTEEKLCSVQSCITEALLSYWAPRFWMSHCVQEEHGDMSNMGLWEEWCYSPISDKLSHHGIKTMPFLRPNICLSQPSHIVHTQLYSSRSQLLDSRTLENMLHALCFESRAGLYFTHFCEQSGNQVWENAIYLWSDLQHYHELFYQDGTDPYRIQREAQVLYFTYLYSSARRSIGVDEKIRREVYNRLMPPFEELFDKVEEHALNILLQPWTLLVNRDKESFQKMDVQEEVYRFDEEEYKKVQSGYEESKCQMKQVEQCGSMTFLSPITHSTPFLKDHNDPESWSSGSPNYQSYRLGSLLRHRHEIGHFMSFLQNQDSSIHLTCWLDLEQYRRTPQKDKAVKQERSSHITTIYLNRKYFFGPDSPASAEQQNNILCLAGGLERLKLECLSNQVVVEIQEIVRNHIEKTWLPQFLSTAEFTERQKHKPKLQAADWFSQHHRCRRRREAWKAEGLWMSSSKEILLFRQILLNPVTCMQFQQFVSLKGDFLENDVLFWLEVQRYKDLYHSHSDEATIQQKISTIINCFINSSMPPTLQIDIPPEQAQLIVEKHQELGPYIFRVAQMSVFNELLKFWPEFQELSSSVQEKQLLPLLQEKRVEHRATVRRQRRKEEEEEERMRTQEEQDTESCLREKEDTDDDMDNVIEREERSEQKSSRTQSKLLPTSTQPLSWSYSKYMAALKREEVLLRRQSQLQASSTASDFSTCSIKSIDSKHSPRQPSRRSSEANSQQCNRGGRAST